MTTEFTIFKTTNLNKVSITVALPAFNATKIIWLALESLVNQKIKPHVYWELIICEEYGESRNIVNKYIAKLKRVNCVRLHYIYIYPNKEGFLANQGIYLLLEKWVRVAKTSSPSSYIYVLMACDIYAHPHRLMVHYNHFQNKDCIISTQPIGPFYNINNRKIFIYDGTILSKTKARHLNMAFRLEYIKHIRIINKRRSIDTYIQNEIILQLKNKFNNKNNIYYDTSDNWKYGFDTDGMNNISKTRKQFYNTPEPIVNNILTNLNKSNALLKKIFFVYWCLPLYQSVINRYKYDGLKKYIPEYIIDKLNLLV